MFLMGVKKLLLASKSAERWQEDIENIRMFGKYLSYSQQ